MLIPRLVLNRLGHCGRVLWSCLAFFVLVFYAGDISVKVKKMVSSVLLMEKLPHFT